MKRKLMISITLAGLFFSGFVNAESFKLNCWDGTYAYDAIRVNEVSDGYEVTFEGSSLGAFTLFQDQVGFRKEADEWQAVTIFAKFPRDTCSVDRGRIACTIDSSRERDSRMYVRLYSRHLGETKVVISDFALKYMFLETEGTVRLSFSQFDHQFLGFEPVECYNDDKHDSGNTNWGAAKFPEDLREYLRDGKK